MKKIFAISLAGLISAPVFAGPPEHCELEQVSYEAEVCDTRTVYVDVAKTRCEYDYTVWKPGDDRRTPSTGTVTIEKLGNVDCPYSVWVWGSDTPIFDDGEPDSRSERTRVGLTKRTEYTEQQATTEQYNCRTETKWRMEYNCRNGRP